MVKPLIASMMALISLSLLSACSDGGSGDASNYQGFQPFADSTRASRLADEFDISCENGQCPASTGVLFFSNLSQAEFCTTFVAGEYNGKTVVMTNKHCVENVVDGPSELAFRFPGTNESARCERILTISPFETQEKNGDPKIVPDYSVVLLDRKLAAQPLSLSQEGLPLETPISIQVAWQLGQRSIVMREIVCSTGGNGVSTRTYTDAKSANISLYDCSLKPGNSGSPIFNNKGQVAAIVQIAPKPGGTGMLSLENMDTSDYDLRTFGAGTNLACVASPELHLNLGRDCQADDSVEIYAAQHFSKPFSVKGIVKALNRAYLDFVQNEDSGIFVWTFRPDDGERVLRVGTTKPLLAYEMTPMCVVGATDPDSKLMQRYYAAELGGAWHSWQHAGEMDISSPGWLATLKLDKFGQPSISYSTSIKAAHYSFDPSEIAKMKTGDKVEVKETVGFNSITLRLPLCAAGVREKDIASARETFGYIQSGNEAGLDAQIKREMDKAKSGN